LGDIFFNDLEQDNPLMEGFEEDTGKKCFTILDAADRIALKGKFNKKFKADISYYGTYLPEKREYINKFVFPLAKKYDLRLYGSGWNFADRALGWIQKGGLYLNIPYFKSIRREKLEIEDEADIYKSSLVSINIHGEYQIKYGGSLNQRTFKIPLSGGFQITDFVFSILKYFEEGKEIVIARTLKEWFEKIDYYVKNPDERNKIIEAGRKRVLAEHTYHNRVKQIIDIYNKIQK